jgi:uncharacterized protein YidB (DUF937 family)
MGLLDTLLGKAATVKETDQGAIGGILDMINDQKVGGLEGLTGKLTQAGLGSIVNSWISTGKNKSVKSSQLNNILGSDLVAQLASKLGVSQGAAVSKLAKFLPLIIDKLTPDGKVDSSAKSVNVQDLLGKLLKK